MSAPDGGGGGVLITLHDSLSFGGLYSTSRAQNLAVDWADTGSSEYKPFPWEGAERDGFSCVVSTVCIILGLDCALEKQRLVGPFD